MSLDCVECGSLVIGIRQCRSCRGPVCDTCAPDGRCQDCHDLADDNRDEDARDRELDGS